MLGTITNAILSNINTIYYHGSCPDGIGSREVLKIAFPTATFVPYYFTELTTIPDRALFIDCSPKGHQVEDVLKAGGAIAEHHDSFLDSFNKLKATYPNQLLFGDTSKAESGICLAVKLVDDFKGSSNVPSGTRDIATLLALSDTWQSTDANFAYARMVAGYIAFFGNDFCMPLQELANNEDSIRAFGKVQDRKTFGMVKDAIRLIAMATNRNYNLAFINDLNISNAAETLRQQGVDVIIGYVAKFDTNTNRNIVVFSLRASDAFDCSVFCKANGGGGHVAAAGFTEGYDTIQSPIQMFMKKFYEHTGKAI